LRTGRSTRWSAIPCSRNFSIHGDRLHHRAHGCHRLAPDSPFP
jgi:hypothetical protein